MLFKELKAENMKDFDNNHTLDKEDLIFINTVSLRINPLLAISVTIYVHSRLYKAVKAVSSL